MSFDPAIRQIIATLRKSPNWDSTLDLRLLQELWPDLVGESLADATSIDSIRGGRVMICVPDPTWREQLLSVRGPLLDKMNAPWPHRWIRDIGFVYED
jgi:predicted nucleic acid-binding Zn ribbon protein